MEGEEKIWTVLWVLDGEIKMESFVSKKRAEDKATMLTSSSSGCPSLKIISGYQTKVCCLETRIRIGETNAHPQNDGERQCNLYEER